MFTIYKLRADHVIDFVAKALKEKCLGNDVESQQVWKDAIREFGPHDIFLDPWFDMSLAAVSISRMLRAVRSVADF